ncbi:MAG: sigma-70 family RNA polymerase sigma factor [Polyangia bacterium]
MQTMRAGRSSLLILFFVLLFSPLASAQVPNFVEPYEVLYGKPQAVQRTLAPDKMAPSAATLALVQTRTEAMLARLGSVAAALGPGTGQPKLQHWAADVKSGRTEAEKLRDRGKHYAAWRKATSDFLAAEFLSGLLEAFAKEAAQDATSGTGSLSRLNEVRARLDAFQTRLQVVRVSSVSVALALSDAYSEWLDATSLLDLVQNRPDELFTVLEPLGVTIAPEKRAAFLRLLVEPFVVPLIQGLIEDSELELQASQADPLSSVQPDEAALRQLARTYADAARANLRLAQLQRQGRRLPARTPRDEFLSRLGGSLLHQSITFEEQHRDDRGLASALLLLGTSRDAYASSLDELAELQVRLDPAVAAALDSSSLELEMDRLRLNRIVEHEQRAREAAAQAQAVLGHVPALIGMTYLRGQELAAGSAEDREFALALLIKARTLAELAAGLGAAVPRDAAPLTPDQEALAREQRVLACIERLRFSETAMATGYLLKKAPQIGPSEIETVIEAALVKACTRARDLQRSVRPLFWVVLKQGLADWFREVAIFERARPKLTATCSEVRTPLEDMLGHEQCDLLQQAMSQLSDREREIIRLRFDERLQFKELGERLNISEDAARMRVNAALQRLRKFFEDRDALSLYRSLESLWSSGLWASTQKPTKAINPCESRV